MNSKNSKKGQEHPEEAFWEEEPKNDDQMEEEEEEEGGEEFEVEQILDKKIKRGKTLYLVKWKGYSLDETTWEPVENLGNAPLKIKDFENQLLVKAKEAGKTSGHEDPSHNEPKASKTSDHEKKASPSLEGNDIKKITSVDEPSKIGGKRGRKKFEEDGIKSQEDKDKPKKGPGRPKKLKDDENKKGSEGKVKDKTSGKEDEDEGFKIKKLIIKESNSSLPGETTSNFPFK